MTKTTTYRKAYDRLVASKSDLVVKKDGTIKSFEEYVEFAEARIRRQLRSLGW